MDKSFTFRLNTAFGDDFVGEPGRAKVSYNFKTDGVTLYDGITLASAVFGQNGLPFEFPEDFIFTQSYCGATQNGERLLIFGKGGEGESVAYAGACSSPENGFARLEGFACTGELKLADALVYGNRVIAFTDGSGVLFLYDGGTLTQGTCPVGTEWLVRFDNRLVAVTEGAVYFSEEDSDVFSYSGDTVCAMPSDLFARSAVAYGDELFVVGLRGCMRLSVNSYSTGYIVRSVYNGCERFYPRTVAAGADGVQFLTERGRALFDGTGITFTCGDVEGLVEDGVAGFVYGGEYFALIKTAQNAQKRMILVFGGNDWYASDIPITCVSARADGVNYLLSAEGKKALYQLEGSYASPLPVRRYESCKTDFGINGKKVLKSFSAYTDKDVRIIIEADGRKRVYRLRGGKGRRILRPFVSGEVFSFTVITDGCGVRISKITATVGKEE